MTENTKSCPGKCLGPRVGLARGVTLNYRFVPDLFVVCKILYRRLRGRQSPVAGGRAGTEDADWIKFPSAGNPELSKRHLFRREYGRVTYSLACLGYCQEFCLANFCLPVSLAKAHMSSTSSLGSFPIFFLKEIEEI